jgi:hypothetical protein
MKALIIRAFSFYGFSPLFPFLLLICYFSFF